MAQLKPDSKGPAVNYRERHKAVCSQCGHVEESRGSGTFIDTFFLPEMCANCGSNMPGKFKRWYEINESQPHWQHVIETLEFVPPVRTWNPITWLRPGDWKTIETTTLKA